MRLSSHRPAAPAAPEPVRPVLPFDPEPMIAKGWDALSAARDHLWRHAGPPPEDVMARFEWAEGGALDRDAEHLAAAWLAEHDPAPF